MSTRQSRPERDVEKDVPVADFVATLRRLADGLESGDRLRIQVAGERISIPPNASLSIEHERGDGEEEIELQLKWAVADD